MGSMMMDGKTFEGYDRPDLIDYVLNASITIPFNKASGFDHMMSWLKEHFDEPRPGCILTDAMKGRLNYREGDWQYIALGTYFLIWFAREQDRALFTLTWL